MTLHVKNAFIILIDGNDNILLIENLKKNYMIPGGTLDKDETPVIGAQREFFEEVGVKIKLPTNPIYYDYNKHSRIFIHLVLDIDYYVRNFKVNNEAISAIKISINDIDKISMRKVAYNSLQYGMNVIKSVNVPLFLFYRNRFPANGNKKYYIDNIINSWSDLQLEKTHDFIQWLFPDKTGGVNKNAPLLSETDIDVFKKDSQIRQKVIRATIRMMIFFGYILDNQLQLKQIKPLLRTEKGVKIGLNSSHNYSRLTRMMIFLNKIDMELLSSLIFLMVCYAMQENLQFRKNVKKHDSLVKWMNTQPYLIRYKDRYDIDDMKPNVEVIDFVDWTVEERDSDDEAPIGNVCATFRGLEYTGNSCYQDSTLLALFAIQNRFIDTNMLFKNLFNVKNIGVCSSDVRTDIMYRQEIQKELNRIAISMRGGPQIRTCSGLRKLISRCPGPEEFHKTNTQDAGEFLLYLFNVFNIEDVIQERISLITNDVKNRIPVEALEVYRTVYETSPIISVHSFELQQYDKLELNKLVDHVDDTMLSAENMYFYKKTGEYFQRRIEINRIVSANYLIFKIERVSSIDNTGRRQKRSYTPVICPQTIQIGQRILHLHAIVVHQNVHYTCNIRCGTIWYYYNDIVKGQNIIPIGSYKRMLLHNPGPDPVRYGTLYFYS